MTTLAIPLSILHLVHKKWGVLAGETVINKHLFSEEEWNYDYDLVCVDGTARSHIQEYLITERYACSTEGESENLGGKMIIRDTYAKGVNKINIHSIMEFTVDDFIRENWDYSLGHAYYDGQEVHYLCDQAQIQNRVIQWFGRLEDDQIDEDHEQHIIFDCNFKINGVIYCGCRKRFTHLPLFIEHLRSKHRKILEFSQRLEELEQDLANCDRECEISDETLLDPVTRAVLTDPVILVMCGHTMNKSSATTSNPQKLCPICRTQFTDLVPNRTVLNIIHNMWRGTKQEIQSLITDIQCDIAEIKGYQRILADLKQYAGYQYNCPMLEWDIEVGSETHEGLDVIHVVYMVADFVASNLSVRTADGVQIGDITRDYIVSAIFKYMELLPSSDDDIANIVSRLHINDIYVMEEWSDESSESAEDVEDGK
jgi:hypothetical protein